MAPPARVLEPTGVPVADWPALVSPLQLSSGHFSYSSLRVSLQEGEGKKESSLMIGTEGSGEAIAYAMYPIVSTLIAGCRKRYVPKCGGRYRYNRHETSVCGRSR